ncbi:MAG: hypothetical protein RLZ75_2237 [Pseudomonadota bacterium]
MNKETSRSASKATTTNKIEEFADDDIFESSDFASLTESHEEETIKRDSRKKIEIYWEKKRLKDLFDDIDESEFDF